MENNIDKEKGLVKTTTTTTTITEIRPKPILLMEFPASVMFNSHKEIMARVEELKKNLPDYHILASSNNSIDNTKFTVLSEAGTVNADNLDLGDWNQVKK